MASEDTGWASRALEEFDREPCSNPHCNSAQQERDRIVAWHRARAEWYRGFGIPSDTLRAEIHDEAADALERGEHVRKKAREGAGMIRVTSILIAEDDHEVAWPMYNEIFAGVEDMEVVHRAETPDEVWACPDLDVIDVVLMDGSLVKMDDGYDLAQDLMDRYPHLKVIITSFAPDYVRAKSMGVKTWVKKYHFGEGESPLLDIIREEMSGA